MLLEKWLPLSSAYHTHSCKCRKENSRGGKILENQKRTLPEKKKTKKVKELENFEIHNRPTKNAKNSAVKFKKCQKSMR
jgi:hypothetical protein